MKSKLLGIIALGLIACNQNEKEPDTIAPTTEKIDIQSELAAIEETREAFQLAIKEKRYADLKNYVTPDMKAVSPGGEDWLQYKKLRENSLGQFSYDSIRMRPEETVIVSDTVAYDFGTSSVYYTNEKGEPVELTDSFLVILKKDRDGVWKLHREVASSVVE